MLCWEEAIPEGPLQSSWYEYLQGSGVKMLFGYGGGDRTGWGGMLRKEVSLGLLMWSWESDDVTTWTESKSTPN